MTNSPTQRERERDGEKDSMTTLMRSKDYVKVVWVPQGAVDFQSLQQFHCKCVKSVNSSPPLPLLNFFYLS